jgi:GNAT superfamily N-acetyltransferase
VTELAIRPAALDDAESIEPLFTELGHPTTAAEFRQRWTAYTAEAATNRVLVAVLAGRVVGLVATHVTPALHRPTAVGRITVLVVAPDVQGRGVGARLVAEAETLLRAAGVGRIELTSGTRRMAAHRFYERVGYQPDALRFSRSLDGGGGR